MPALIQSDYMKILGEGWSDKVSPVSIGGTAVE